MDGADLAHLILSCAAVIAGILAWYVPRATSWIAIGAISYVTSVWWHNSGLPHGVFFGAATNLVICYMFWIFADAKWEMRLWNFFHLMLVVDLLYIFGVIRDIIVFAISLEIINLAALIFIAGVGIMERAGGVHSRRARFSGSDFVYRALWAERSPNSRPWWQR